MGSSAVRVLGPPETPPPGHFFTAADSSRLHFCGRHVRSGGVVSFDWPCTSFRFKTSSSRVWLRMDGAKNYFNVLVNGSLLLVLKTQTKLFDYALPPDTVGVIEVQKRTEARIGTFFRKPSDVVTFHGIVSSSELDELPTGEGEVKRLEILGDSETSGFGNQGPSQPGAPGLRAAFSMDPSHQDANQAWPALVAGAVGAEFHNIAWSGAGVVWNVPGCTADVPFHDLYLRQLGTSPLPTLETSEWKPDAVLVYLGGNDWWSLHSRGDEALIDGLREFLTRLRAYRGPETPICILLPSPTSVCACIGSLEDQATFAADMSRCWRKAAELVEDEKVFLDVVVPDPPCLLSNPADWGQAGHWSVEGNKKWASAVLPVLRERLGWTT